MNEWKADFIKQKKVCYNIVLVTRYVTESIIACSSHWKLTWQHALRCWPVLLDCNCVYIKIYINTWAVMLNHCACSLDKVITYCRPKSNLMLKNFALKASLQTSNLLLQKLVVLLQLSSTLSPHVSVFFDLFLCHHLCSCLPHFFLLFNVKKFWLGAQVITIWWPTVRRTPCPFPDSWYVQGSMWRFCFQ